MSFRHELRPLGSVTSQDVCANLSAHRRSLSPQAPARSDWIVMTANVWARDGMAESKVSTRLCLGLGLQLGLRLGLLEQHMEKYEKYQKMKNHENCKNIGT